CHIIFIAQICREKGEFDIKDVIEGVYKKMRGRHPHVFEKETSAEPIEKRWEEIKREEKEDYEPLAGIPITMPALLRAFAVTKRAARVGFDWQNVSDVYDKLFEEIDELKNAHASGDPEAIREELGDTLFTMVNLSRFLNADPEDALRSTIDKFIRRFSYIEKNIDIRNTSLEAMDELWNRIKKVEKEED
ncbi:MAG TPA: MazG family protein, partial [Syntrophorhabdaceae bacterium]|nr:MazG family protein [Syntrophorhabdaceae bacterium]